MAILPTHRPFLRRLLITIGALFAFVVLWIGLGFYDSYRTKANWLHHREAAIADGVEYDLTRFAPSPVLDAENFAATPFFQQLFAADEPVQKEMTERLKLIPADKEAKPPSGDWLKGDRFDAAAWNAYLGTSDLLEAVRPHEALLAEISQAAQRPAAVFPLHYDQLAALALPHGRPLLYLAKLYRLRGNAYLAANAPEKAFDDLQTLLRLAEHSGNHDPILITSLIQGSLFKMAMELYWQGLASHQWSDAALLEMATQLRKFDFLLGGQKAFRAERAAYVSQVELLLHSLPEAKVKAGPYYEVYQDVEGYLPFEGWLYQSLFQGDRFFEISLLPLLDPVARRVDAPKEVAIREGLEALRKKPHASYLFILYSFRSLLHVASNFAYLQTLDDFATLATALERYHRQNGEYPETLEALTPSYLEKLPHDLVTGEPLRYRRTDDGRFLLYGVGWNGTDDGGKSVFSEGTSPAVEIREGDWVWPSAAK